jgi:hypothetical protein
LHIATAHLRGPAGCALHIATAHLRGPTGCALHFSKDDIITPHYKIAANPAVSEGLKSHIPA